MSHKVADVYLKWLQGGALFPDYFPVYNTSCSEVQAQYRVAIASFIGHMCV
ncbi:hypothetical protein PTSG_12704 [Salpingoeca rosetta]|uniref:Uncharacterized protein n=1 Tax=Salpingoeca rosetta (strain ATCC 50818 / BSB-021) TaxID=946362 RepID=F2UJ95_SALR5|nr:uncharacterized protein PTSG_12704 [Salpingoeca rosetta]EGD77194.1 hypothetical protein PTSG_12704 [Salpingoeca rosetta]|eukprot:XP_004990538.1 hypothetical protein PTSG_12704 [Salpingoeca rosetta]